METVAPEKTIESWVTKRQLASRFQCCPRTINNLMTRRILPYRRLGRILRFDPGECDKAMDAFKVKSISERKA